MGWKLISRTPKQRGQVGWADAAWSRRKELQRRLTVLKLEERLAFEDFQCGRMDHVALLRVADRVQPAIARLKDELRQ